MSYLREGDTLVVTRLDRLARSVVHLAQIASRFKVKVLICSLSIRTLIRALRLGDSCSICWLLLLSLKMTCGQRGKLKVSQKAHENGVKFGRPVKLTDTLKQAIYDKRAEGATIGQLAKEYHLGEASIYRAINSVKQSIVSPYSIDVKELRDYGKYKT